MNAIAVPALNQAILMRREELVSALRGIVKDGQVIHDEPSCRVYGVDALNADASLPLAVVLPSSIREVSQVLRYCYEAGLKVTPRGAGTSLVGGAVAPEDGIILCLSLMDRVLEVDPANRLVRVEAGITNVAVSEAAKAYGLRYAPDPSSRSSSTIGGNIATNAGGMRAVLFGSTDRHVLGLKVVLIDGEVIELGGGELEASGIDLIGLLVGSEGMLGVIVEAVLRIVPQPEARGVIMLGFQSISAAISCAERLADVVVPSAMEVFDRQVMTVCEEFAAASLPCESDALIVMEFEGQLDEFGTVIDAVSTVADGYAPNYQEAILDEQQIHRVWRALDAALTALGRLGSVRCVDVAVPPSRLAEAMSHIGGIAARYGLRGAGLCRTMEGVVRSVLLYDSASSDDVDRVEEAMAEVAKLTREVGGVLAGEHGIGLAKREALTHRLTTTDLTFQMRLKSAFDTEWLLNNGKVYPLAEQAAQMTTT